MKVTVYGTGSWGTALAQVLSDNGHDVWLYGVDPSEINDINENHRAACWMNVKEMLMAEKGGNVE